MKPRVAMIARWGAACGMDNYSRDLVEAVSPSLDVAVFSSREAGTVDIGAERIFRDWVPDSDDIGELVSDLSAWKPDVIHIQFNWGNMSVGLVSRLIEHAHDARTPVVLQLHASFDHAVHGSLSAIVRQLKLATLVIVHGDSDVERLAQWGVADNVWKWRLGERFWPRRDPAEVRACLGIGERTPVLATFGFLQPRKRVLETIRAVELLRSDYPKVLLIAANALHGRGYEPDYYLACREQIVQSGLADAVELIVRYLDDAVAMTLMQAADAIVLPYEGTAEGTSAAAKFCAAAGRPMIVSRESLFDEYRDCALTLESPDAAGIDAAVRRVLADSSLSESLSAASARHAEENAWPVVGAEYVARVRGVIGGGTARG